MDTLTVVLLLLAVIFAVLYFQARKDISAAAREQYDRWRSEDRTQIIEEQRIIAAREAQAQLTNWRGAEESSIREDAISRSKAVIVGKVTEHVAPWLPDFPYNPKDARFIGSPVDMIVFDGADSDDVRRLVFVEVKANSSGLTKRQRQIRDAISEHRVEWRELRVPVDQAVLSTETGPKRLIPG
jgi:predicted Holliday junction resolvase-like endonuclease